LHYFSLARSLIHNNVIFAVLSVRLREAAEFRDYTLVDLLVLYRCMLHFKSRGHNCDNCLLFWACCLHSDYLYELWFVFITECEFDNSFMEGTPSVEWWHVWAVRTHRSVKWFPNHLNHHLWISVFHSIADIKAIARSYATIIRKSKN